MTECKTRGVETKLGYLRTEFHHATLKQERLKQGKILRFDTKHFPFAIQYVTSIIVFISFFFNEIYLILTRVMSATKKGHFEKVFIFYENVLRRPLNAYVSSKHSSKHSTKTIVFYSLLLVLNFSSRSSRLSLLFMKETYPVLTYPCFSS